MASAAIVAKTVRFRTTDETLYSGVDDTATSNGIGQSTSALRNVVYTSTLGNFPQIRFLRGSDNKKYAVIAGKLVKKHTDSGSPSRRRVRSTQRAWELTRRHTPVDPFAVILGGADQLEDDGRRKTHMFLRRCMQPLAQYRSGSTVVLENVDRRRTVDVAPTDLTSTGRRRARQTASTWFSSRNDKMTATRTPAPPQTKTDPVTSSPVIGNLSAKGRQQMVPNLARVNPPSPMVKTPTRERFSATTPGSVEDQNGLNYTDTAKQHSDDAMTTDNHDARGHHISADDDKMGRHRKKVFDAWRMFRRAVRLVKILLGMVSLVTEKQNEVDVSMEKGAVRTVTDLAAQPKKDEQSGDTGLTFDVFYYKANKEINVSSEVRSILSMPPETRTQKQLQTAMYGLQHLKSFAEYPLPMQEKLCKVGWFQHIPPKRIIIRQGHYAENFYFIIFGQVIVEKMETNILSAETQLRTVALIGKGGSFGEIALKQLSKRTATVISKDTVQLLAIGRNDFFNIFMPKQGPDAIPEHVTFISTLKFMNRWPVETLLYHPEACLLHFFKPGVVIVNDSNKSEYLYIIKSGSCQVMKRLHVAKSVRVKAAMADNHILPDRIESKTDSGLPRPEPAQIPGPLQHTMNEYTARIQREAANKQPTCGGTCGDNCTAAGKTQVINDISLLPLETSVGLSRSKYSYIDNLRKRPAINVEAIVPGGLPTTRRSSAPEVIHTKAANQLRHVGIRSHHADEGMRHHANDYSEPCVRAARSMFTTINVLKPKDIFGLSTLDLGITVKTFPTSVSLVSNGAECIMLSSKFFVSNANDEVIENLRQITHDYPDEETLQDDLQKKVTWDCYKRRLMHMTLKSKNITTS